MYAPAQHDELTGPVNYLDEQLTAIRAAAFGLTEEQARETPCRSALPVGGIIKHAAYVMRGALERLTTSITEQPVDAAAYAAFSDSFAVRDDETVAGTIEDFDRMRAQLLATVAATDPAGDAMAPPAPWHGIFDARPIHARDYLVHLVQECARRGGHADIIREQIDDMAVPTLVLTLAGASANDFFQPYPGHTPGVRYDAGEDHQHELLDPLRHLAGVEHPHPAPPLVRGRSRRRAPGYRPRPGTPAAAPLSAAVSAPGVAAFAPSVPPSAATIAATMRRAHMLPASMLRL
jgi:hypothetical protein